MADPGSASSHMRYPRVSIEFCTQCKWLLRAAYFAQELLSTFSTSLGEVALQPSSGGTFIVHLLTESSSDVNGLPATITTQVIWDRKAEGRFPETKELKRRVRDIIDPKRDLGHVDGKKSTPKPEPTSTQPISTTSQDPLPQNTNTNTGTPVPHAINHLQALEGPNERKFTPMDVDVSSRPSSSQGQGGGGGEVVDARVKAEVSDENSGGGYCKPGEDCEDCV
ncbi:hypothetical protein LZ554_000259 [Drepanopeziza brunnea f. sp. 'monogermtubi']|nr:hypothetical protein LZ554_000259 [Drepanopeziza brunnea f. sp. 'monogermtubi']